MNDAKTPTHWFIGYMHGFAAGVLTKLAAVRYTSGGVCTRNRMLLRFRMYGASRERGG